jgi:hypothetical protein
VSADHEQMRAELAAWWAEIAQTESDRVVAKAIEYGATDLVDLGDLLLRMSGRSGTVQEAAELGVLFYLAGKVSRWTAAVTEGRPVSLDTIEDIGVYCRMAQRIRSHGGWPGTEGPSKDKEGPSVTSEQARGYFGPLGWPTGHPSTGRDAR